MRSAKKHDLSSLRYTMSVGEPLNPEAVVWGEKAIGLPFHDNWWQTETGAIMIANYPSMEIEPGSMGRAVPRHRARDYRRRRKRAAAGEEGDLAVRPGWPSMFRIYWNKRSCMTPASRTAGTSRGDRATQGRGRLLLVRGPRRRRDQHGGPPGGAVRGGERADRASGGGGGRA